MKVHCAVVLTLLTFAAQLHAVTIDQPERRLVVRHSKPATVTLEGERTPAPSTPLAPSMSFTRRHDEVVRVVVDDPNPLVYTYKWQGTTKTQTDDFKAAAAFADALGGFSKALSEFKSKEETQRAAATASGRPHVGSRIGGILAGLGITPDNLATLADDLTKLSDWAGQIPHLTSESAASKDAAERVKQTVLGWDVETRATRAQKMMRRLDDVSNALLVQLLKKTENTVQTNDSNQPVSNSPSTAGSPGKVNPPKGQAPKKEVPPEQPHAGRIAISDEDLGFAYLLASSKAQRVDDLAAALRAFVSAAGQINDPLVFDPIEYAAGDAVTGTLEIGTGKGVAAADAGKRATGTFKFVANPYTPAHLRNLAAAVIYSFVEAPQYSTKQLSNGKYQIVRTDSGNAVNGLTMAGMLSVTPVRWSNPTVGGSFQVGLSPVKDRLAILGGATLNLYDLLSLGGGLIYQQSHRLGTGLRENQDDLASADALKTTTKFKPGFYLSITIKRK